MDYNLSEKDVQDSFHNYLKSSITQAKVERLLEPEPLANAEADMMVTGPALCLYFAALRCTTVPPSVPLLGSSKFAQDPKLRLSERNCPLAFRGFFHVWASTVAEIRGLPHEHQHDLARVICGLPPVSQPPNPVVSAIAIDLRAVAIEISQRRSFQERYASDWKNVPDTGSDDSSNTALDSPSPVQSLNTSPLPDPVRNIFHAALGNVISQNTALKGLLAEDRPRAYFVSISLAILEVGTKSLQLDGSIDGGHGMKVTLGDFPDALKPLMRELAEIGKEANKIQMEDNRAPSARRLLPKPKPKVSRLNQLKRMLQEGVGRDREASVGGQPHTKESIEWTTVELSNRINALALKIFMIEAFQERKDEMFAILSAVG